MTLLRIETKNGGLLGIKNVNMKKMKAHSAYFNKFEIDEKYTGDTIDIKVLNIDNIELAVKNIINIVHTNNYGLSYPDYLVNTIELLYLWSMKNIIDILITQYEPILNQLVRYKIHQICVKNIDKINADKTQLILAYDGGSSSTCIVL